MVNELFYWYTYIERLAKLAGESRSLEQFLSKARYIGTFEDEPLTKRELRLFYMEHKQ